MSTLDRVLKKVEELNFDNEVVSIHENRVRYAMLDTPVAAGTSNLYGSMIEVMFAMCTEIDELTERLDKLSPASAPVAYDDTEIKGELASVHATLAVMQHRATHQVSTSGYVQVGDLAPAVDQVITTTVTAATTPVKAPVKKTVKPKKKGK